MKNNINLIRDRSERPPSATDKISVVLIFVMLCAYALTLGLGLFMVETFKREAELVQRRIERIRESPWGRQHPIDPADRGRIGAKFQVLNESVVRYESRWEWGKKLQALREHLPEEAFLTSFSGRAGEQMQFGGYADHSDGQGRQRLREFITGLESDPLIMRRFETISVPRSRSVSEHRVLGETLEFELRCSTGQ